jgi:hypothetical protein
MSFEFYMNIQYKESENSCQKNVMSKEEKANNLAYCITRKFVIYAGPLVILADYRKMEIRIC